MQDNEKRDFAVALRVVFPASVTPAELAQYGSERIVRDLLGEGQPLPANYSILWAGLVCMPSEDGEEGAQHAENQS